MLRNPESVLIEKERERERFSLSTYRELIATSVLVSFR